MEDTPKGEDAEFMSLSLQERAWLDPSTDHTQLWTSMLEGWGKGNCSAGVVGDIRLCNPVETAGRDQAEQEKSVGVVGGMWKEARENL